MAKRNRDQLKTAAAALAGGALGSLAYDLIKSSFERGMSRPENELMEATETTGLADLAIETENGTVTFQDNNQNDIYDPLTTEPTGLADLQVTTEQGIFNFADLDQNGIFETITLTQEITITPPDPVMETTQPEAAPLATSVNDDMSFSEAFAAARDEVGAGGVFEWHGQAYNTFYKEEFEAMSPSEISDYYAAVNRTDFNQIQEELTNLDPTPDPIGLESDPNLLSESDPWSSDPDPTSLDPEPDPALLSDEEFGDDYDPNAFAGDMA